MNKNKLNKFEKWVVNQKTSVHVVLAILTYFIWIFVYIYCKNKSNKIQKLETERIQNEKIAKEKQEEEERLDYVRRISREKNNLIFDEKIKVKETSHPKRQKLLKDIDFIANHGDIPNISIDFEMHCATIYYNEIDSKDEKEIGCFYDYVGELYDYNISPDYNIKIEFETSKEDDGAYVLYCIIKVYN